MATAAAMKKVAEQPDGTPEDAPERPLLKTTGVTINDAGMLYRNLVVRMPEGAVPDDIRDPQIWRAVQGAPHVSLVKLDHLLILGFDESWGCEAIVKKATQTEAHLTILKVFNLGGVAEGLFSDHMHEIFWNGAAYSVRRKSDKVEVVAHGFATEAQAARALHDLYPRTTG